jgi:Family of unknown function (DUF6527)
MLNLSPARAPRWTLSGSPRRPDVHPSIDAHTTTGRCHFWVCRGRVVTVRESYLPYWVSEFAHGRLSVQVLAQAIVEDCTCPGREGGADDVAAEA